MFDTARTVASTDGVQVVVCDEVGAGTPVLFSHATGFHGRVFAPVAAHLAGRPRTTFDYRGHGDTAAPRDWPLAWEGFGDDALAVARDVSARNAGRRIVAVGHSMGGAGLVMAALREPSLFAALVVYEPIIFPPESRARAREANPLAEVTRRRRCHFADYAAALANFAAKPPLNSLHPAALDAYVRYGFAQRDDGVHLKCDPEFEAQTYEMGVMHDTWQRLGEMKVPTHVIAGAHAEMSPAAIAPRIADLLGRATFVEWSDLGHFGPLEDPARFAKLIAEVAAGVGD
jgi:pimeloyl-ACP methyl ester carboxylesterase